MKLQAGQANLARRLAQLRAHEGWSAGDVQRQLAAVGCVVPRNAASRIEQGTRAVTVDELVAFSRIYNRSAQDLLTPVELVGHDTAKRIASRIDSDMEAVLEAVPRLGEALVHLRALLVAEPEAGAYLIEILARPYLDRGQVDHDPESSPLDERLEGAAADAISEAWHAAFEGADERPFRFIENRGRLVLDPQRPFITEAERAARQRVEIGDHDGER